MQERALATKTNKHSVKRVIIWIVAAVIASPAAHSVAADDHAARFTLCGDRRRVTCVVDGDTFWFRRQKIRIADIDAPELSPPRCEYEREKGEAAKLRLLDLLNAGPFSLATGSHDRDRYGRKRRIVSRDGRSLGAILVDEDLARRWDGTRRPWCE